MTRHIPANAETREFPNAAVVAYCFQSGNGPAFLAYKGRQSKPAQRMACGSVERRDEQLAEYVKRETARESAKRERHQAAHGLEVGDILFSTWGYEQTNVTFYQLTRVVSGRSATVRQIEADTIENKPGSMTGTTTPRPGEFAAGSKDETRRATGWQTLGAGKSSHGGLDKWDGRPRNVTSYG
ncbi:hypothetical protein [Massilia sp. DWR3-1-1]|uniref:hypothetical protein n=1 Tax=Massilia sp. DWR3-1-1 TaxID=2804559 RepID=UPI003CE6967B